MWLRVMWAWRTICCTLGWLHTYKHASCEPKDLVVRVSWKGHSFSLTKYWLLKWKKVCIVFILFFLEGFPGEMMMYYMMMWLLSVLNDSVLNFVIYFLTVWELKVIFDFVWEISFQTVNYKNTFNQSQTFILVLLVLLKTFIEVFFC